MSEAPESIKVDKGYFDLNEPRPMTGVLWNSGDPILYTRSDLVPQWQPIETAPDGVWILGWAPEWERPAPVAWIEAQDLRAAKPFGWHTWEPVYGSAVCFVMNDPTYWQPLPTPPPTA